MLCILILVVYTGKNPETRFDLEIPDFDFAHLDLNYGLSIIRFPIFNSLGEHERDMSIACKWWSGFGIDLFQFRNFHRRLCASHYRKGCILAIQVRSKEKRNQHYQSACASSTAHSDA